MDPERWRKVEALYEAALAMEPSRRAALLEESCGGDASLRSEVESLLACASKAQNFLEAPAVDIFPDATRQAAGQRVAHYEIEEKLGEGGMGVVYKAKDTRLGRSVALKFVKAQFSERFEREARAIAALNHPHIATLYEVGEHEGAPYLAMEFVEGRPLKGPRPVKEVIEYGIQIADALAAAHAAGIVHRDLKPANILVTEKGTVKILDFGLAKLHEQADGQAPGATTVTATIMGTPGYMSPEQAKGESVDQRTDVWSLGVVLYEMLSGRLPFQGDSAMSFLYSIANEEPTPLKDLRPDLPLELARVVNHALKKDLKARYSSASELGNELKRYQDSLVADQLRILTPRTVLRGLRKPKVAISVLLCLAALSATAGWLLHRQNRVQWARQQALPEIEQLLVSPEVGAANYYKAYKLAADAEKYIRGDPELKRFLAACSGAMNVTTEPPGAVVSMKEFSAPEGQWKRLGVSPIRKVRVPFGVFWWKFEKLGSETVMAVAPTFGVDNSTKERLLPYDLNRVLDPTGKVPSGMVRVQAVGGLDDFFIDRYEVTNRQYKQFVDKGGYHDQRFWKHSFVRDGKTLSWKQATDEFVDKTGRPGPSTWQAGDFPEGQEDYPVSGVSWYEATAYAEYAGRSLPTATHWGVAMGVGTPLLGTTFGRSALAPMSNFGGKGPAAVGSRPSMTAFGAYDMAGNVREWCSNATKSGRIVRGGSWEDAAYMWNKPSQAPAFDREQKNGFRCALYPDPGRIPVEALAAIEITTTDFSRQKPVPDSVFQIYKEQFSYDKRDLNARVEWRNQDSADWVQEKVVVDAAYGNEKLPIYLFLPKKAAPPYQTVIYLPGSGSVIYPSSRELDRFWEFEWYLSPLVKNRRAVIYPVYKSTFERQDASLTPIHYAEPTPSRQLTEYVIQVIKDFKTCVDYLETRHEIDQKRLAYLGFSWGGHLGPVVLAVDDRLAAGILLVGGRWGESRPEVDVANYWTRVRVPTLMLNGKYDTTFNYDTQVKPMFDLLGIPAPNKKLILYDTDHLIPRNEYIKETLAWLDRYLGPVEPRR